MTLVRRLDGRRLTGLNPWSDGPAAAVVVSFLATADALEKMEASRQWQQTVAAAMTALGWPAPVFAMTQINDAEAVWTARAPVDRLYAAVALCEAAVSPAVPTAAAAAAAIAVAAAVQAARDAADAAGDPALLAIEAAARRAQLPFLWCDDLVSVGWGARSKVWTRAEAAATFAATGPTAADVAGTGRIPVALITGTNGKTTTARLLSRIARCAGKHVGGTGTDGLVIDEVVVEAGDWTGPGGARTVLRDPRVEIAVLEAARGGILRRGLGVTGVDAAAVTNVSDDHLGEWGVNSVAAMADVKVLVGRAVRRGGRLVVFDDGGALSSAAARLTLPGVAILRYTDGPATSSAGEVGRLAAWVAGEGPGATLVIDDATRSPLRIAAADIPMTVGGAARYNVANALCAALLARGLGLPDTAIEAGLRGFSPNASDSPGRTNLLSLGGARVLLDFGHNPDGVRRVAEMAARLPATRRLAITGQAGDRTDAEIRGLIDGIAVCQPDRWLIKAMPSHARGREAGEVVRVLRAALAAAAIPMARVSDHPSEAAAVAAAIDEARPGDLLLLFVQVDAAGALAQLVDAGATEGWPVPTNAQQSAENPSLWQ